MNESSSGFLGSLSFPHGTNISIQGYIPFSDSIGDEIDLDVPIFFPSEPGAVDGIQPGINTLNFELFYCQSQACQSAMGPDSTLHVVPTSRSSIVTAVQVPDGDSSLPISLSAFGAFALAWRWRRREG